MAALLITLDYERGTNYPWNQRRADELSSNVTACHLLAPYDWMQFFNIGSCVYIQHSSSYWESYFVLCGSLSCYVRRPVRTDRTLICRGLTPAPLRCPPTPPPKNKYRSPHQTTIYLHTAARLIWSSFVQAVNSIFPSMPFGRARPRLLNIAWGRVCMVERSHSDALAESSSSKPDKPQKCAVDSAIKIKIPAVNLTG